MGYVLELHPDGKAQGREGLGNAETLQEAMYRADTLVRVLNHPRAWLLEGDATSTRFGQGRLAAVYSSGDGWTILAADPRGWFDRLQPETRAALIEDPGQQSLEQMGDIFGSGTDAAAWWPGTDPAARFTIPDELQAFIRSTRD